ncbi:MAG: OB-fold domain-containing protein [Actinobacteria bacterium]|nr:MAG: OB-fold domain-containing protein [Actinomycetota bacterium]
MGSRRRAPPRRASVHPVWAVSHAAQSLLLGATLYSFTVIRHGVIPDIRDVLPIIAGVADLDGTNVDGTGAARLVASVADAEPENVHIGQRLRIDWYDVRDGVAIPILRIAE